MVCRVYQRSLLDKICSWEIVKLSALLPPANPSSSSVTTTAWFSLYPGCEYCLAVILTTTEHNEEKIVMIMGATYRRLWCRRRGGVSSRLWVTGHPSWSKYGVGRSTATQECGGEAFFSLLHQANNSHRGGLIYIDVCCRSNRCPGGEELYTYSTKKTSQLYDMVA